MFKMSTGVAALLVVGVLGLACTNQAGLNPGEEPGGAGGAAKGGQTGGVAGGSGGTIAVGGVVTGGSGGAIATGGVGTGGTSGTGGSGGKGPCLPVACPALACVGGFQPNPDPCGCPVCGPNPDSGVTKDAGSPDGPICLGPPPPCALPQRPVPPGTSQALRPAAAPAAFRWTVERRWTVGSRTRRWSVTLCARGWLAWAATYRTPRPAVVPFVRRILMLLWQVPTPGLPVVQ